MSEDGSPKKGSPPPLADVKELEYISALHQTDTSQVREDGSIEGWFAHVCDAIVTPHVSTNISCFQ